VRDAPAAGNGQTGPVSELTPGLVELAAAYGVATEYWDWRGQHVRVSGDTLVAVLAALGVDASTERAAEAALATRRAERWQAMLPPCLVTAQGRTPWFWAHVPHGDPVEVWVELEDGGVRRDVVQQDHWVEPARVDGSLIGEATFALPGDLPLGWHRLHARSADAHEDVPLVVTPGRLAPPERRTWGFMAQVYAVRSRGSWGLGDLDDLAELAAWSGYEFGAGFVLVNPMHAGEPVPPIEPSPYLPVTRRFASPLYLRVEAVAETAYLPSDDRARVEQLATELRKRNQRDDLLDRDAVWEAKREALTLVHRVPLSPARQASYDAFRAREGAGLVDFATWCALAERHGPEWTAWPGALQDPHSAAVARQRELLAERVDFFCWLQWLLDEQLAAAQRRGRDTGMPVGIVHDLAVGVHARGADTWALGDALASGVSVGAPPDAFNQQGQDWNQPPWRPDRLAATGYAAYRDMLGTVLRNAGGIRVDHVMGLFRLWWVPAGASPADGTYVSYDHEALVGILALEAHRAGAVVVGEDLGTVEPWVRAYLRERGVLGTSILWFERDAEGRPVSPERWRELCLATVTTHDLPPTAGYLAGEHVELRGRLGLLTRPLDEERAADAAERAHWRELLERLHLLRPGVGEQETVEALYRFLLCTPARMVGVALADAVGDRRVHNQPGTHEAYPNWRLPLTDGDGRPVVLENLVHSARVRSLAGVLGTTKGTPETRG
jgi:4-alpha-glucanotransferase